MLTATPMMPKPIHRCVEKCSWVTKSAHSICMMGVRYWSMPIVDKRSVRAPWAKHNSGSAVIRPALIKSSMCGVPSEVNVPWPACSIHTI